MLTHKEALIETLKNYQTNYKDEQAFCSSFLELLSHPRAFYRDHLPGHITGSAWIVDESKEYTLLTHHAKLNRWLQPGGHADGEENVLEVARKEAIEETGLTNLKLPLSSFFDLDIHTIPARKEFPEHLHYDIRFLFIASRSEKLLISEESHDLGWIHMDDLSTITNNNTSIMRMAEKVIKLF